MRLVAVSKTYGADHVAAAVAAGQLDFGENKVQEGLQKIGEAADTTIRWHLIGHLQSNKARKAGEVFDWIHAVDSEALLRKLDAAAAAAGRRPRLLVQVDLARRGHQARRGAGGAAGHFGGGRGDLRGGRAGRADAAAAGGGRPGGGAAVVPPAARDCATGWRRRAFRRRGWPSCRWA